MIQISPNPILNHIEKVGGIAALPGITGLRLVIEKLDTRGAFPRLEEVVVRTLEEKRAIKRLEKIVERARLRGWIDLFIADDVCVTFLHLHPVQLYGLGWFDFDHELAEEAA